jgi:dethiobiotin synthetase
VKRSILFVTGTDTGVGKTVLACLLTSFLRERGVPVAAVKPICSGDRNDARALQRIQNGTLTLDRINPWYFRAPLAPLLAARREKRRLTRARVVEHIRSIQNGIPVAVIEGAGGLLSPLGEDFDSRDLIAELNASTIVVCPNRLGALNQARQAHVVLVSGRRPDAASRSNPGLLRELVGPGRVHVLPWLNFPGRPQQALSNRAVRATLKSLMTQILNEKQA